MYQLKYQNGYEIIVSQRYGCDVYKQGKHCFGGTLEQCERWLAERGLRRADLSASNGGGRGWSWPNV